MRKLLRPLRLSDSECCNCRQSWTHTQATNENSWAQSAQGRDTRVTTSFMKNAQINSVVLHHSLLNVDSLYAEALAPYVGSDIDGKT